MPLMLNPLHARYLNVKKNSLCFWLWAFGNTAWLSYDLWLGLYSRAALDVVQLAFAIWGIVAWKKKSPSE